MSPLGKSKKVPDLAIILSHKREMEDGEDGAGGSEQSMLDAADALIEAVHAKDPEGVVQAYKAMCDLHAAEGDEGEDGAEEV